MNIDERGVQIPATFSSPDKEAKFLEHTDLTDLAPAIRAMPDLDRPRRSPTTTFAIRLDTITLEHIRDLATLYDIGPTQLVRQWVVERLRLEKEVGGLAPSSTGLDPQAEIDFRRHAIENVMEVLPAVTDKVLASALEEFDVANGGSFMNSSDIEGESA
jgi:hypothetical protein